MEEIFQFLWSARMLGLPLTLSGGERVRVIDPGIWNHDSGPDFFNAKINVDGQTWAGNVEIHFKASDWHRHRHSDDPAYDNIILHVVSIDDTRITRSDGSPIPQMAVSLPERFYETYGHLTSKTPEIRCGRRLQEIDGIRRTDWIETLAIERLQTKAARVEEILHALHGDWNAACFITFARGLGFGLNSLPFEMLAKSINLNHLRRHSDNLLQTEALFFGQAGLLDPTQFTFDRRYQLMCREYAFLSRKYSLAPIPRTSWKFAKTRPQNFPYRRIALLAKAMSETPDLLDRIISSHGDDDRLRPIFGWQIDPYWSRRYTFGSDNQTEIRPPSLSNPSINLILINVAAPLLYAYGLLHSDHDMKEEAMQLLLSLPPEKNTIIRDWQNLGFKTRDAMESQALIHLRKEYCDLHKCLRCRFGHRILSQSYLSPP